MQARGSGGCDCTILDKAKVEVSDGGVRLEPGDAGSCLLVGDITKTDLDGDGGVGH